MAGSHCGHNKNRVGTDAETTNQPGLRKLMLSHIYTNSISSGQTAQLWVKGCYSTVSLKRDNIATSSHQFRQNNFESEGAKLDVVMYNCGFYLLHVYGWTAPIWYYSVYLLRTLYICHVWISMHQQYVQHTCTPSKVHVCSNLQVDLYRHSQLGLGRLCSNFYLYSFSFILTSFSYFSFHSTHFSFQCTYFSQAC